MAITKIMVFLFIILLSSSAVLAEEFDTIDNAPEEKERGTLSKADSKKALDGFRTTINTIQSTLERCESNVCRQVSANADKRELLVTQAQENIDDAESYIVEVRGIVREDITALEKCRIDVCKEVLSQEKALLASVTDFLDEDSDADGYGDVALRSDQISLIGFGSFSVSKIHEDDTTVSTSALYEPESTLLITGGGGGAGKASFKDLKLSVCPEDNCRTVAVEVQPVNEAPTASVFFELGFSAETASFALDDAKISLTLDDAICSQERNEIHCTDADDNQLVVAFARNTELSCVVPGAANDPALKKPRWLTNNTQEKSGGEGQVYCWGENERGDETQVIFETQSSKQVADVSGEITTEQARELAMSCPDDKCITDLLARCGDDVCVVATVEAAINGEIILGEDRDMVMPGAAQHCRDDKCIVELAERCGDDVCVASVAEHCKDDKCIAELAQVCGDESCVNALADLSEEVTDVCIVVRESCPSEARADGKCIVKSDVCTSDNQQDCVQLADRCPDDARADGSCVAASTVCGTSQGRVAGSPCPPDEALCMDGTCEPLTWPRCESDLDIVAVPAMGIASDDCDDTDCDVRPSATKKGYDYYQAQSDVRAGINPHSLNDSVIEYLQNQSELKGANFGLAIAYAASGNEQVRNVRYNNETDEVEVEHVEEVKLFGFIPMQANARSTIDREGNMKTDLPWWSFLASKRPDMLVSEWDEVLTEEILDEEVDILGMGDEK